MIVYCLCWENNLLSCHHLSDVQIEEVTIEDGLDNSSNNCNDIIELLVIVSEDPVEDVESAVGTQSEEIVAGDGLCLPGLGDHEELGQDGHTLQVDGEGPQDLHHAKVVVEDQGEEDCRPQQELDAEGVMVPVVGGLEFEIHEVDGGSRAGDEEDLHAGVVETDEVGHQVQVAGDEHHQEQDLGLAGDSGAAPGLPDLEEEEDDGQ